MKRTNVPTITGPRGQHSSTGTELGKSGAGHGLATGQGKSAEMLPETASQHPGVNQKNLVDWLEQSCGVVAEMRMGIGGPVAKGRFLKDADMGKALSEVEQLLMPAPPSMVEEALAMLWATAKRRKEDAGSLDLMLEAYLRFLNDWPGDVVLSALSETYEWFPDRSEIENRMKRHAEPRRLFASRLRTAIADRDAPDVPEKPVNAPVARPDDAQAIQDGVEYFRRGGRDAKPVETDEQFLARIQSDKRGPRPETLRTIGRDTLIRANMNG